MCLKGAKLKPIKLILKFALILLRNHFTMVYRSSYQTFNLKSLSLIYVK